MEDNKASGPDGFPAEFYKKFWEVINFDLMAFFNELSIGDLSLYKLNFGVITLLPKKDDAVQIQQYEPIFFIKCVFQDLYKGRHK
jgi:hypothetical protein